MACGLVVSTLLLLLCSWTTMKCVSACTTDDDCPGKESFSQKGVCIFGVCDLSQKYGAPCHHDKQCEKSDIKFMCNEVCVCDVPLRYIEGECQQPDSCQTNFDCKDKGDDCVNGFCHPKKSMLSMAVFATFSSVVLALCLVAIILVYTGRKLRRKKRLFRSMSAERKTPIYVGSIQPNIVMSTIPEELQETSQEDDTKTPLNQP